MPVQPTACGLARDTSIATPAGPVPVQDLAPGDLVLTADRGPQPLRQRVTWTARDSADTPVTVPPRTLGNPRPLHLAPGHRLLLRGPCVQLHFGCAEVLVPASAFCAVAPVGVEDAPQTCGTEYHRLLLPGHHLVHADGAWAESLFPASAPCADTRDRSRLYPYIAEGLPPLHPARMKTCRMVLHDREARFLVMAMGLQADRGGPALSPQLELSVAS